MSYRKFLYFKYTKFELVTNANGLLKPSRDLPDVKAKKGSTVWYYTSFAECEDRRKPLWQLALTIWLLSAVDKVLLKQK